MPIDTRPDNSNGGSPPRLLYVVTEDWAFLSHRLPMARAARNAGFEVHVATRGAKWARRPSRAKDLLCIQFPSHAAAPRRSPRSRTIAALRRLHRQIRACASPSRRFQACVLGMIATLGRRCACVNAFIGLGYAFTSKSAKACAMAFAHCRHPFALSDRSRRQHRARAKRRRHGGVDLARHRKKPHCADFRFGGRRQALHSTAGAARPI